jgi:pyruvate/2-oxoglutarate/acetoin dehydrogenase E1 component
MIENRKISFVDAINEGTSEALAADDRVILMGLGVPDPKGIFGTTLGLRERFGAERVFDTPTAENGVTGIALGASLVGYRPIITHQRVEFSLLAVEQMINQAAKWNYMTAGQKSVPMVVRLIVGRGWGQGPQHSQFLEPIFAHVPGLKVVAPSTPIDAKGMLLASVQDNDPVIFFEHRWLHGTIGYVPQGPIVVDPFKARLAREGKDVTIVASSYMVVECLIAAKALADVGISSEVLDLRSLRPLDIESIILSVKKTRNLVVVDNGWSAFGVGGEIISSLIEKDCDIFDRAPKRLGLSDVPIPSTRALANLCYPSARSIVACIGAMFDKRLDAAIEGLPEVADTPNDAFKGPF